MVRNFAIFGKIQFSVLRLPCDESKNESQQFSALLITTEFQFCVPRGHLYRHS
jgi:hypothetical protein